MTCSYTVKQRWKFPPQRRKSHTLHHYHHSGFAHDVVSTPPKAYSNHSRSVYLHTSPPPFRWYTWYTHVMCMYLKFKVVQAAANIGMFSIQRKSPKGELSDQETE